MCSSMFAAGALPQRPLLEWWSQLLRSITLSSIVVGLVLVSFTKSWLMCGFYGRE